jgi:hypothetical protein
MKQMSVRYAEVKKQAEKICKVTYKWAFHASLT